jgi:hypothetical protein
MNRHLEDILSKLRKVKGRNGNWVACCPAHDDRNPSMTIRETPDGTILMHCFGGCSIAEIASALGVDLSDLFPPSLDNKHRRRAKPRFYASDLLKVIDREALLVVVAAMDMAKGKALSDGDRSRLIVARARIREALEMSGNE